MSTRENRKHGAPGDAVSLLVQMLGLPNSGGLKRAIKMFFLACIVCATIWIGGIEEFTLLAGDVQTGFGEVKTKLIEAATAVCKEAASEEGSDSLTSFSLSLCRTGQKTP